MASANLELVEGRRGGGSSSSSRSSSSSYSTPHHSPSHSSFSQSTSHSSSSHHTAPSQSSLSMKSGNQQSNYHAAGPAPPRAQQMKRTVTTSTTSTYIPPPRPAMTQVYHAPVAARTTVFQSHAQAPQTTVIHQYTQPYPVSHYPTYGSGFNLGQSHIHLHMGVPTFLGGSGFYDTGPAYYAGQPYYAHHYHHSSVFGELMVLLTLILLITCVVMIFCSICSSSGEAEREDHQYDEEHQGLIVEHHEKREEIYEDYNPHLADQQTRQEERVEYVYHADGGITENRIVQKTEFDFVHQGAPSSGRSEWQTAASQGSSPYNQAQPGAYGGVQQLQNQYQNQQQQQQQPGYAPDHQYNYRYHQNPNQMT